VPKPYSTKRQNKAEYPYAGTKMLKHVRNFLNGAVYGTTLIIPGVSATIFAIILGFYDELIYTMNHFREDYRKNTRYFLIFLFGVATGTVAFSSLVLYLLTNFPFPTMMLFMGLLLGIVPFIYSKTKDAPARIALREIGLAIIGFVILVVLSFGLDTPMVNPAEALDAMNASQVVFIFFAGIVNGATLVIPGLSGAFILLIMGLYPLVIFSVSSIAVFLGDIRNISLLMDIFMVLAPFGIGAVFGLLGMARLIEKMMSKFPKSVYAVILGLLLGSVIALIQNPMVSAGMTSTAFVAAGVITFAFGCAAAFLLGKKH